MHRLLSLVPGFFGFSALLALGGCGSSDSVTPAAPSPPPTSSAPAESGDLALVGPAAQERHAAPTSLTATPGDGQVALAWNTPEVADGIAGYQLNYGKMGRDGGNLGGWADIEGSDHRTTTHTVTGLSNGSEYRFRIRAQYVSGPPGRKSERATATPAASVPLPPPPKPPTGFAVTSGGWTRLYLTWTAPDDSSRTGWQLRHRLPRPNIWSPHNPWSEWVNIADADATEYKWTVPDRQNIYSIQFRAVNASGAEPVGSAVVTGRAGTSGGMRPVPASRTLMWAGEGGRVSYSLYSRARPSAPFTVEIRLSEVDWDKNPMVVVAGGKMDSVLTRTGKVTAHPSTLTFTPSNWDTPQRVIFTVAEDDDTEGEEIIIEYYFTGGGEGFEKVDPFVHTIKVWDNDR